MLEEVKASYIAQANMCPSKELSKQELFNYCATITDNFKKDCYFAELVLRYWNRVFTYYNKSKPVANITDCYNWVIDSLHNTIEYAPWLQADNKLHDDPNAGDKVFNKILFCTRANFFQALQKQKRSALLHSYSHEAAIEQQGDVCALVDVSMDNIEEDYMLKEFVYSFFVKKRYVPFFMLVYILSGACFTRNGKFDINRLITCMKDMSNIEIEHISQTFGIPTSSVKEASYYVCDQSRNVLLKEVPMFLDMFQTYFVR